MSNEFKLLYYYHLRPGTYLEREADMCGLAFELGFNWWEDCTSTVWEQI